MSWNVLVTGGASGLGKAIALRYASAGANVCICDINAEAASEVLEQLAALGSDAFFLTCDITQQDQIDALKQSVLEKWTHLDVLVNNAGVATAGGLAFEDIEQWQWVLDINLLGLVRMTRAFAPEMAKQKGSSQTPTIINIASQAGITPVPMMASYNASKAAVVSFSETMHLELARDGIQVSVACPSFFNTLYSVHITVAHMTPLHFLCPPMRLPQCTAGYSFGFVLCPHSSFEKKNWQCPFRP